MTRDVLIGLALLPALAFAEWLYWARGQAATPRRSAREKVREERAGKGR